MHFHRKPGWMIPERQATPESVFMGRRKFMAGSAAMAAGGVLGGLAGIGCAAEGDDDKTLDLYPVDRNPKYTLDRPVTEEEVAAAYNNFYEFGPVKTISRLAQRLQIRPWQVEVGGMVNKPQVFDIDELIRSMPLEERLYRLRCVEAWAMAVPWTGFPFSALIRKVQPSMQAK